MGILSSIKEKILGKPAATTGTSTAATLAAAAKTAALKAKAASLVTNTGKTKMELVDVEAVVEAKVKAKGVPSNWRVSIVDLLKALDLDSSLSARVELARELNYTGKDPDGSAEKNIWLHKAVMQTLAENGGNVPKELLK